MYAGYMETVDSLLSRLLKSDYSTDQHAGVPHVKAVCTRLHHIERDHNRAYMSWQLGTMILLCSARLAELCAGVRVEQAHDKLVQGAQVH